MPLGTLDEDNLTPVRDTGLTEPSRPPGSSPSPLTDAAPSVPEQATETQESPLGQDRASSATGSGGAGLSTSKLLKGASKATGKSNVKKYAKIFGPIAGVVGVIIVPLILFFFFLALFKLNHIKELFIDYRFAQVDSLVSDRINAALAEAKTVPAGTPDQAPLPEDAPLAEQLGQAAADAKVEGVDLTSVSGQDAQNLTAEVETELQTTADGALGTVVDEAAGIQDRTVQEVDPNETEAQAETDVTTSLDSEIQGTGGDLTALPPGQVQNEVNQLKTDVQNGSIPDQAAKSVANDLLGATASALDLVSKFTIACIAIDIWGGGQEAYTAYKAGGLVRAAESVFSWADCQKQGQCNLTGIGAVADKFDNGSVSFINSAGAQQASGQPITGPGLTNQAMPLSAPFGQYGAFVNYMLSHIIGLKPVCQRLLQPNVQVGILGLTAILLVIGAITPGVDIGTATIVGIVVAGFGTFFAGTAGTALLATEVSTLAHTAISAHGDPLDMGNYMSGGAKIMADMSCMVIGCRQQTAAQASFMLTKIHNQQVARAKKGGLAYQLFDGNNPRSLVVQLAFAMPTTPATVLAHVDTVMSSIFSPDKWIISGSHYLAAISTNIANADNPALDPITGLPNVGPVSTQSWDILNNENTVKSSDVSKFQQCYLTANSSGNPQTGASIMTQYAKRIIAGPTSACDSDTTTLHLESDQYQADKYVIHSLVMIYNQQANVSGGGSGSSVSSGQTNPGGLSWPEQIAGGTITQCYTLAVGGTHPGIDIANSSGIGTPIYAAAAGTVVFAGPASGYGPNFVAIQHGTQYYTSYGHMNSMLVKAGDMVTQGQQIGTMGNFGTSSGPHLHFNLIKGSDSYDNGNVDPLDNGLLIPPGVANPNHCPPA
ncbi:MAG: M23 family metallopeptidase [Candidatus Saccharimonadia bacterium]